jgi:ComF family protein
MKRTQFRVVDVSGFFLPLCCVLCGVSLDEGCFCECCEADLPRTAMACERCGQPLAAPLPVGTPCIDCQRQPPAFDKAFAPFLYTFPIDSALKALKFKHRLYYAPALGALLLPSLAALFPEVDALLPVPLHRLRHAHRGFNQATELCRPLHKKSKLPLIKNVRRVRFTRAQTGLDAAERRRNMRAAFEVRGRLPYRHPLVIDDVITTGETCKQLSAELLRAGAERVSVLALARAASP